MRFFFKGRNVNRPRFEQKMLNLLGFEHSKTQYYLTEKNAFIKKYVEFIPERHSLPKIIDVQVKEVPKIVDAQAKEFSKPTNGPAGEFSTIKTNKLPSTSTKTKIDRKQLKKKRTRVELTKKQKNSLENVFREDFYPDAETRSQTAAVLNLKTQTVKNWFQNKRQNLRNNEKVQRAAIQKATEIEALKNYLRMFFLEGGGLIWGT